MKSRYTAVMVKTSTLVLIVALLIGLTGCAVTTKRELMSNKDQMQTWRVDAPIDEVFRKYKDLAEERYGGSWTGGGFKTMGFFYGQTAELTVAVSGPNGLNFCTHFDIQQREEDTLVTFWYKNSNWGAIDEMFKALLPLKE